jgi:hypothetical protein
MAITITILYMDRHQLVLGKNKQQSALICTTPLFYTLATKCFGSSMP